jgi:hypothetical protein
MPRCLINFVQAIGSLYKVIKGVKCCTNDCRIIYDHLDSNTDIRNYEHDNKRNNERATFCAHTAPSRLCAHFHDIVRVTVLMTEQAISQSLLVARVGIMRFKSAGEAATTITGFKNVRVD